MSPRNIVGTLLLFACAGSGCDTAPHPTATPARPNVLWIAVDTLRADRLGCYGNTRELTPSLDRLARQGARFENCFSHAPWTLPSFASMFTALDPLEHGAGGRVPDFRALAPSIPTLPERFRAAGYDTLAVVNVEFLSEPFGTNRGFAHTDSVFFDNNEEVRDARQTTDTALRWLGKHADGSFFLFVHYFDPHAEYRPPQPFRRRFAADVDRESDSLAFGSRAHVVGLRQHKLELEPATIERAAKLYDGEVAYVDQEIGRLLDELSRAGLDENTLVVFTADHGEEFLDHGGWEHGHTLYDELLHVPLILRQKGRIAPRTISSPVGHVDLARTLCNACAVPSAPSFRGRDLAPLLRGEPLPAIPLIAFGNFWGAPLSSLRDAEYKLIVRPATKDSPERRELYRWREDPHELRDLYASEAVEGERMTAELARLEQEHARQGYGPGPRVELTDQAAKRIKGLGYTGDDVNK